MKNDRRKKFNELLARANTLNNIITALEYQEQKNELNGKNYSELTGLAIRKAMMSTELEYIYKEHIKGAKDNAGSRMEYMVARDIYNMPNHIVTNKKGIDIENGRWNYEIKMISVDSGCHGYPTMEQWYSTFAPSNKILIVVLDRRVYRVKKTHTNDFISQASFKEDKNKKKGTTEWRLKINKTTMQALKDHSIFEDTIALY